MSRAKDLAKKNALRARRKRRVRGSISGTAQRPRVSIFKSNKYLSAQAINDIDGVTITSIQSKALGLNVSKESATKVAAAFADALRDNGIKL